MCRFLGVVADEPAPIGELVGDDLAPFLDLACEHEHGWGVAHRAPDGAIRITKAPERGDTSDRLRAFLDTCVTDMAIVHLRMASPGLPVSPGNTHPFGDTRAAFVHNGDYQPRDCLVPSIDPRLLAGAEGQTDSERYYLAARTRMDAGTPPAKAITQTAADVRLLADRHVALNCLLLTPDALHAYQDHDPASEVIQRRGETYFQLHYREAGGVTLVASQGWPQPAPLWQQVPFQTVLEVAAGTRETVIHGA
ncbi:class II glutamine amidotransferase [Actinacidiphila guanduensis]|uniref:Predicted glutamine amidotransferase n=1 Tax=Actinacidiphila guanduensis TaxID=310781 RepID=A0A1H0SMB7_9ACTN|nr:class II glutamine amidotransferase [Actinacidiphila guanduensis]SDP42296.1 Predicted glutamine amidotransferase [Actinacidiphila guanduensis]